MSLQTGARIRRKLTLFSVLSDAVDYNARALRHSFCDAKRVTVKLLPAKTVTLSNYNSHVALM